MAGKVADRTFPVACPLPDCKKAIGAAEAGLVLSPEEQATLGQVGHREHWRGGWLAGWLVGKSMWKRDDPCACMHCQVLTSRRCYPCQQSRFYAT